MARIEDLISEVADARLRQEIAREVAALKKQKKFGLVFEEHLPEQVQLPGLPVKPGARVMRRGGKDVFLVDEVFSNGKTRIRPESGTGDEETVKTKDLVVVKRFGEPIHPTLVPVARLTRAEGRPYHIIINADNFHALQLLLYCYAGQVDVIYIDPPYNTGARDWRSNNDYVDANDQWRHSKWLSFMERRLRLAKRLLKPDGVLIVTIDEHEFHHLGVLLRQTLTDAREVQMVTIVTNTAGSMSPGKFSRAEEYAYFCFFGQSKPVPMETDMLSDSKPVTQFWFPLFRSRGLNDRPSKRPNLVYPIAVDPKTLRITGVGRSLQDRLEAGEVTGDIDKWQPDRTETVDGNPVVWPILDTGEVTTWQLNPKKLFALFQEGFCRVREQRNDGSPRPFTLSYIKSGNQKKIRNGEVAVAGREVNGAYILKTGERTTIPKSTWKVASHDARLYGTTMLRALIGQTSFTYPKSPYATADTLMTVLADRKDALILDFFAGSGTTYHATALLNVADGGNRRCLLVTNNEVNETLAKDLNKKGVFPGDAEFEKHGICESVTWPRCKFATQGHRDDGTPLTDQYIDGRDLKDGFKENLEYFRLDFLDPHEVAYGEKFEAILPILWLMAGAKGEQETARGYGKWFIPKQSPYAVLIREEQFAQFKRELAGRPDVTLVFLVTDSEEAFREMSADLPGRPQTKMLYKSYLDNFKINTEKNL